MSTELERIRAYIEALPQKTCIETIQLYPGIEVSCLSFTGSDFSMRSAPPDHILQINYCKAGQIGWTMKSGERLFLNPGSVSLHTAGACAGTRAALPAKFYQGLTVLVDLAEAAACPPEPLRDTELFRTQLPEKFCRGRGPVCLAGNERTEGIFSGFYDQPEGLRLPYQRVKTLELLLYLAGLELAPQAQRTDYPAEQIEIVREIHDQLLQHMEQRVTIEELSKRYLINPTTLKAAFKSVYGNSIAAHFKEHRMEQAAKLLEETDLSIAEVAQAVGYDSQSKFAAAFKAFFQVLPREYRKRL